MNKKKGIVYARAIKVFNEKNILADICRVGGTSVGLRVDTEEEIALMNRTKEQPSIKIKHS